MPKKEKILRRSADAHGGSVVAVFPPRNVFQVFRSGMRGGQIGDQPRCDILCGDGLQINRSGAGELC